MKNIYFIGIGGIGMSAIARYFYKIGKNVAGYDKTSTQLTDELTQEGISIHFEDEVEAIEPMFLDKNETLVVITPAIPKNHKQLNYFLENGFEVKKRAEVLGLITQNSFSLAVAGTHGKTTTSSMLAHILCQAKVDVTSFLGGILENYQSNLVGNGTSVTVVEADEFDRSFLHLHPNIACVISNDADHLDIYGTNDSIKQSFLEFSNKIHQKENLFIAEGVQDMQGVKVGFGETSDIRIKNKKIENGCQVFDIQFPDEEVKEVKLYMPGNHNVLNATIAFAMAKKYGVNTNVIKKSLFDFKGVRRRFSYKINEKNMVYIDDYAHHPTEINAVADAVKELYPHREITAIFQPHLFTRTRDFMDDFAASLSKFDKLILLDIYPARELPIEGITSQVLLDKIDNANKILLNKNNLIDYIKAADIEVLLTIGAGDLGEMTNDIKDVLLKK